MSSRYRPISYTEFKLSMDEIGFEQIDLPEAMEFAFERVINCASTKDRPNRFKIRIMSSVDQRTLMTREVGADAIRILLLDTQPMGGKKDKIVKDWTAFRTTNGLQNTLQRARDAWGYVSKHPEHHCSCGSLMVERKGKSGKFLGCTGYPECRQTKPISELSTGR